MDVFYHQFRTVVAPSPTNYSFRNEWMLGKPMSNICSKTRHDTTHQSFGCRSIGSKCIESLYHSVFDDENDVINIVDVYQLKTRRSHSFTYIHSLIHSFILFTNKEIPPFKLSTILDESLIKMVRSKINRIYQ